MKLSIILIIAVTLCATSSPSARGSDQEIADTQSDLNVNFSKSYRMSNKTGDHFNERGADRWKITVNFADGTWSGRGQGVKADGRTACTDASTCSSLSGVALVNACTHSIYVAPLDSDNLEQASKIEAELGRSGDCTLNAEHAHITGETHGGTAHGSDQ